MQILQKFVHSKIHIFRKLDDAYFLKNVKGPTVGIEGGLVIMVGGKTEKTTPNF